MKYGRKIEILWSRNNKKLDLNALPLDWARTVPLSYFHSATLIFRAEKILGKDFF